MKNIFLIGDSIAYGSASSPGYDRYVKHKLEGRANVFYPDDNCRFAQYTLRYVHDWAAGIDAEKIDIVHWNNGLWDLLRLLGDEPFTPCEVYVDTMERVYKRIKMLFPQARIIFATTTPVIEEMTTPDFTRRNAEIERYNAAVVKRLEAFGVEINDLYCIAKNLDASFHTDAVHYNDRGAEILANAVIQKLFD